MHAGEYDAPTRPEAAAPAEGGSLPGSTSPPELALMRAALAASRERIDMLIRVIDGEPEARGRAKAEMEEARRDGRTILETVLRRVPAQVAGEARRLAEILGEGACANPPRVVQPPGE